ncbi:hypothetical protein [Roseobacter sp. S98]|uniref:hypothetical protein n=1 Tax=Roseobacter algicola (ex Choi et al. 2025) (nom. illeg.) TaxID=3092138 RepID=UPI0035C7836C
MTKRVALSTSAIWKTRESMMMQLDSILETSAVLSREEFTDIMQAAFDGCNLNVSRFAADMKVSPSTAHRWIAGASAPPHNAVWDKAADWIRGSLREELAKIRGDEAPANRVSALLN